MKKQKQNASLRKEEELPPSNFEQPNNENSKNSEPQKQAR